MDIKQLTVKAREEWAEEHGYRNWEEVVGILNPSAYEEVVRGIESKVERGMPKTNVADSKIRAKIQAGQRYLNTLKERWATSEGYSNWEEAVRGLSDKDLSRVNLYLRTKAEKIYPSERTVPEYVSRAVDTKEVPKEFDLPGREGNTLAHLRENYIDRLRDNWALNNGHSSWLNAWRSLSAQQLAILTENFREQASRVYPGRPVLSALEAEADLKALTEPEAEKETDLIFGRQYDGGNGIVATLLSFVTPIVEGVDPILNSDVYYSINGQYYVSRSDRFINYFKLMPEKFEVSTTVYFYDGGKVALTPPEVVDLLGSITIKGCLVKGENRTIEL